MSLVRYLGYLRLYTNSAHLPWKRMHHGMHEVIVQWRIKYLSL